LRLSAFRLRHFLSFVLPFFPSSLPGLTRLRAEADLLSASRNNPSAGEGPAIHAAVKHAKRFPPSVCLLEVSMDHRVKPGGDESEVP